MALVPPLDEATASLVVGTALAAGERDGGLRALLNADNRRGVVVPRVGGANRGRLDEFPVYCPEAVAGIGSLPATVASRSIAIRLARKTPDEHVERLRMRQATIEAEVLRARLEQFGEAAGNLLADLRPDIPAELDGRAADAWEPLLAIAELAGDGWTERARAAAVALTLDRPEEEATIGVRLLADVHAIFESRGADADSRGTSSSPSAHSRRLARTTTSAGGSRQPISAGCYGATASARAPCASATRPPRASSASSSPTRGAATSPGSRLKSPANPHRPTAVLPCAVDAVQGGRPIRRLVATSRGKVGTG